MIARNSRQLLTRVLVIIGVYLVLPAGLFQVNDLQAAENGHYSPCKAIHGGQTPINTCLDEHLGGSKPASEQGVQQTHDVHGAAQYSGTADESGPHSEASGWTSAAERSSFYQAEVSCSPEAAANGAETGLS